MRATSLGRGAAPSHLWLWRPSCVKSRHQRAAVTAASHLVERPIMTVREGLQEVTVRPYNPATDHPAVIEICKDVYGGTDTLPKHINADAAEPGTHVLVAADAASGRVDGLLCCQQRGDACWVWGARTREQARRRGIGQLLMERVEQLAAATPGVAALMSATIPTNTTMLRLFGRRGWLVQQQQLADIWPSWDVALQVWQQAQQQAQQAQQQQWCEVNTGGSSNVPTLLDAAPELRSMLASQLALRLQGCWRPCASVAELEHTLCLLRQHHPAAAAVATAAAAALGGVGAATEAAAEAAELIAEALAVSCWIPGEYVAHPTRSPLVQQLLEQQQAGQQEGQGQGQQAAQVWVLPHAHPSAAAAAAEAAACGEERQHMRHAGVLVLLPTERAYLGIPAAGIVASSSGALHSGLLHALSVDPRRAMFYIQRCSGSSADSSITYSSTESNTDSSTDNSTSGGSVSCSWDVPALLDGMAGGRRQYVIVHKPLQ